MCISESHVFLDLALNNKDELFQFIVDRAYDYNIIVDKNMIKQKLFDRETHGSTILSNNLAFPHTLDDTISAMTPFIIHLQNPILYYPDQLISTIFCILAPKNANANFINLLSLLAEIALNQELLTLISNSSPSQTNIVTHHINSFLLK